MKPTVFLTTHGDDWILYEEHQKIVKGVYQNALREAVHAVERVLDEYQYGNEGYTALTIAGNRLRILAGVGE